MAQLAAKALKCEKRGSDGIQVSVWKKDGVI